MRRSRHNTAYVHIRNVWVLNCYQMGWLLLFIIGLDYVAHEDIVPYTSTERKPIDHDLFMKFLEPDRLNGEYL